jgi:hypothetical protein
MKCPNCVFEVRDSATWCACGYNFKKKELMETPPYHLAWRVPVAFLIVIVTWFAWFLVAGMFMESDDMVPYLIITFILSLIGFYLLGLIVRKRWHFSVIMLLPIIFYYGQIVFITASELTAEEFIGSTIYTFVFVASSLISAYAGSNLIKERF